MDADERYALLRAAAKEGRDPACADETLSLLLRTAEEIGAKRFLEIGAAEGLTSVALARSGCFATAIEKDPVRAARARENFRLFGVGERTELLVGDAGELLPRLSGGYDLVFLDGPKAQYGRYLPECRRLLRSGGVLVSDDVLLFGWVEGEPPKKRRMLAVHLREYLAALRADPAFETEVFPYGEGVAVSRKR